MFLKILQQLEALDDRRDIKVGQRTLPNYNVDVSEENRCLAMVEIHFFS
jgi:hypothetical protein